MKSIVDNPNNSPAYTFLKGNSLSCEVVWTTDMTSNEKSNNYWHSGCHPDVVQYVWDTLGKTFPINSSCTINGRPSLLHPKSNTLLAVCIGTQYVIRIVSDDTKEHKTTNDWNGPTDLTETFGKNWFFGKFTEVKFYLKTFNQFN